MQCVSRCKCFRGCNLWLAAAIVNHVEPRRKHVMVCGIPNFTFPCLFYVYGCCHGVDRCALRLSFPRFCAWAPPSVTHVTACRNHKPRTLHFASTSRLRIFPSTHNSNNNNKVCSIQLRTSEILQPWSTFVRTSCPSSTSTNTLASITACSHNMSLNHSTHMLSSNVSPCGWRKSSTS